MSMSLPPHKLAIFLFASCVLCRSFAIDHISPNENISFGEELVSSGGKFTLGFFSPKTTSNKYIGIWYNNIKPQTIVWVGNRHNPVISNMTASLTVSADGTLAITASGSSSIILFFASTPIINPIAQLLDTGNFIVRDSIINNEDSYAWQSFDYPTDTLLPSMKLGWDLRMSKSHNLTSWKSELDPSPGSYSLAIDIRGGHEVSQFDGNRPVWRSGMWNGIEFSGIPDFNVYGDFILTFVNNSEEIYFNYHMANPSTLARIVVTHSGLTERYIWINSSGEWNIIWSTPSGKCDEYNVCGANAKCNPISLPVCECFPGFEPKSPAEWALRDSSEGCVRRTRMDCTKGTDKFVKLSNVVLPDTVSAKIDGGMSHDECRDSCLRNCSCTGFADSDVRSGGSGCVMYVSGINDVSDLGNDGQDFYLRLAAADIALMPSQSNSNKKERKFIAITVSLVTGTLLFACIMYCICRKKKRLRNVNWNEKSNLEDEDLELPLYDLETVIAATDNFTIANKLGEGGYGPVYKGILKGGKEIAIKRLSKNSNQGTDEFKNEVLLIAKLQHRNLVRLLGCCTQGEERMLIYEYLPNKSLDAFLFDKAEGVNLDWRTRYHIITGIARGLMYLHQDSRFKIIHRDLKTGNVLLDKDMNPKISDFGLARILDEDEATTRTRRVVGTYGYMSPEYAMDGIFSVKSDVFSFGVIVLEIVSGQRSKSVPRAETESNLLVKARRLLIEGKGKELIDPSMGGSFDVDEIARCIEIGVLCVQEKPEARPTMSSVVVMLSDHQGASVCQPQEPGFPARRDLTFPNSPSSNHDIFSTNSISVSLEVGR